MAKRIKGFVPFGKKGGAKVKAMPSDNDGDEKGAANRASPVIRSRL